MFSALSQLVFNFLSKPAPRQNPDPRSSKVLLSDGRLIRYRIEQPRRAKRLRLTVTPHHGLRVVAPKRLLLRSIETFVFNNRAWIARHLVHESRDSLRPERLVFPSVGESWAVEYRKTNGTGVKLRQTAPGKIELTGAVDNHLLARRALKRWLKRRGKEILVPLLKQISSDTGYRFSRVLIRGQRTLWGSCSAEKRISLNYHLLFHAPELVRYVLIHELCHTVELNHTRRFWALVLKCDPQAQAHRKALRAGWRSVPGWIIRVASS